jgi:hypothetical protein
MISVLNSFLCVVLLDPTPGQLRN